MALNLLAAYDKCVALLNTIPNINRVYQGAPESGAGVFAYITLAPQAPNHKFTANILENECTFFAALGYVIRAGDEGASERALIAGVQSLILSLIAAQQNRLDDTVQSLDWDLSLSNDPAYQEISAREFRIYPFLIKIKQLHP